MPHADSAFQVYILYIVFIPKPSLIAIIIKNKYFEFCKINLQFTVMLGTKD